MRLGSSFRCAHGLSPKDAGYENNLMQEMTDSDATHYDASWEGHSAKSGAWESPLMNTIHATTLFLAVFILEFVVD